MADIKLSFGVDKLSTAENFRRDLTYIIESIESKLPKIKISFVVDEKALDAFEKASEQREKTKALTEETTKYWQCLTQINNELSKMQNNYAAWGKSESASNSAAFANYGEQIEQLKVLENSLKNGSQDVKSFALSFNSIKGRAADAAEELKRLVAAEKGLNLIAVNSNTYNSALGKMTDLLKTATAAQHDFTGSSSGTGGKFYSALTNDIAAIDNLIAKLKAGTLSEGEFRTQIDNLTQSVNRNVAGMQGATQIQSAFTSQIRQMTGAFTGVNGGLTQYIAMMFSVYRVVSLVVSGIKDLITKSIELENVMVDLRIVTGKPEQVYADYLQNISRLSSETATNLQSLITATTTYARLGYSIDESSELAKYTGMLEKVGNIDTETAQNAITSIMKAFSDELKPESIESVMDRLVVVGNSFPISVGQIAEGMLNASSALAAAGNDFNESVALLTAANVTTQDASKSSTGLRTIAARIRNTKAELDDLGEALTEAKYEELVQMLTKHKVALTDINGEYRSTYEIIRDIAGQWDDMTSMEQAALATQIAGVRQQSVFFSLVEQFQEASGAIKTMEDSAGSLERAYSVYTDSTAAHIERLKTSWQTLAATLISSDAMKGVIDLGKGIVDFTSHLAETHKLAKAMLVTFAAFKALQLVATGIKIQSAVSGITAKLLATKTVTDSMVYTTQRLTFAEQQYILSQVQAAVARESLTVEEGTAIARRLGLIAATDSLSAAEKGLTITQSTLNTAVAANPIGALITSFTIFYGIAKQLDNYFGLSDKLSDWMAGVDNATSIATYNVEELSASVKETYEGFKSIATESSAIIPRFTELARGVDSLGNNVKLTDAEFEEFHEIQNQLAELFPELDNGLDSNGNHMLKLQYSADSLTDTFNSLIAAERELARTDVEKDISSMFDAAYNRATALNNENDKSADFLQQVYRDAHMQTDSASDQQFYMNRISDNLGRLKGIISSDDAKALQRFAANDLNNFDELYKQVADKLASRTAYMADKISGVYDDARNKLSKELGNWAQLTDDYSSIIAKFGAEGDSLVSALIGDIDMSQFDNADSAFAFVQDNILTPLVSIGDSAIATINEVKDLSSSFENGEITAGEFSDSMSKLSDELEDAGDDAETLRKIFNKTNAAQYVGKIKSITNALKDGGDKAKKFVSSLSSEDITIAYNIVEANGSMSIDELMHKIEAVKLQGGAMLNTLDFSDFFESAKGVSSSIEKIATSLDKLKSGTALTKNEMVKLAEEFPEMLKQSNLFTDGSIEGQKKLLEHTLKTYKEAYAAHVKEKIGELEASKEVIEAQAKLETEKQKIIIQAEADAASGKIDLAVAYTQAIGRLNQLEAQNYVEYKDGEVLVNSKALNQQYNDTSDMLTDAAENLWGEYANDVVKINRQMSMENLLTWQRMWQEQYDIVNGKDSKSAEEIMKYLQGGLDEYTKNTLLGGADTTVSDKGYGYREGLSEDVLSGALETARQAVEQRLEMLAQANEETDNAIGNLNALLDNLDTIFSTFKESSGSSSGISSSSGSSSSSSDEDSPFKQLYKEMRHLVEMDEITEADFLKWLRDNWYPAYQDRTNNLSNDDFIKYAEEVHKGEKSLEDGAKKAFDALLKMVQNASKSAQEAERDALKQRLSDLKEFYDKQKELLKQQRDEEKYMTEQAEKRKKISDLLVKVEDLRLDNSATARRRLIELNQELAEAQKDLDEFERDHAVDAVTDTLDNLYEAQAKEIEDRIKAIEDALNNPEAMYNQALLSIKTNSEDIKELLKGYDKANGNDEAATAWAAAADALNQFLIYFGKNFNGVVLTGYANGTSNSTMGLHRINERGSEMIFASSDGNQYRLFGTGEKVLDSGASSFLYELARSRGQNLIDRAAANIYGMNGSSGVPSVIQMGDIIIQGNADERTVSQIRRAQQENVQEILSAFKRLTR